MTGIALSFPCHTDKESEDTKVETKTQTCCKDRLFRFIFGSMDNAENILSLYNALNGTNYTDQRLLEITTLEDAVYIRMKNDVSFLISSHMVLWEQQSTYNPNMPLRGLMYFGELYSAYVETNGKSLYGSTLVKIPTPQYVVFYNGVDDIEPMRKLRLSDSFIRKDKSGEFEWTATMYNLNKGKNDSLLDKCKPLKDYMVLIQYIRGNLKSGIPIEAAVDEAVKKCIEEDVMREFLLKHRSEVKRMCITEFNEKTYEDAIRNEGSEKAIFSCVQKGLLSEKDGANELNLSITDFERKMEEAGYKIPVNI